MYQPIKDTEVELGFISDSHPVSAKAGIESGASSESVIPAKAGIHIKIPHIFLATCLLLSTSCATTASKKQKPQPQVAPKNVTKVESVSTFRVGPHTKLAISVYNEADLTEEVVVKPDGTIDYAFVGKIKVLGLTERQIRQKITKRLQKDYLVHPQVSVKVKEFGRVYVFGNVENPGSIALTQQLTALEAIVEAGGFNTQAAKQGIKIVREVEGQKKTYQLSLRLTPQGGFETIDTLYLLPNDSVIVQ